MSPTTEALKLPDHLDLTARPTCQPQTDERPLVRTHDGHVLASVESWRPDLAVN